MAQLRQGHLVTLKDVAQRAGVSVFTASRALSGKGGVSPQAMESVQRAADELGYVVNSLARALRGSKSPMIGVLTADIGNSFFGTLLQAINTTACRHGWLVLSGDTVDERGHYHPEIEEMFVRSLQQARVAGLIVSYPPDEAKLAELSKWPLPLFFVDCAPPEGFRELPFVGSDGRKGGGLVGDHFAWHGYSKWLMVGHSRSWSTRSLRESGFLTSASRCGASVDIVEGGNSLDEASKALDKYFDGLRESQFPEAIFATNERLLQGCYQTLKERNIVVGGQVGVVGYDDFLWARWMQPSVTVIDQDPYQMGCMVATKLTEMIDNGVDRDANRGGGMIWEPKLIVRQSCGCGLA